MMENATICETHNRYQPCVDCARPKPTFWREVFTWHVTREITKKGARILAAIGVALIAPLCYVVGWSSLPVGWWRLRQWQRRQRRREEKEME